MKQYRGNGLVLAAGLLIFLAATAAYGAKGARIGVDQKLHDFGTVWEGAHLEHTFTVTNQGDRELIINYVKTS